MAGEGHEGFAEYARARWLRLVRLAVSLGADLADAEDVAQLTLLRTYVAWRRVRAADDPDAYVARILLNAHREAHRRRRRRPELLTDRVPDRLEPDRTEDLDTALAIHDALADLPREHREVVALRYFADLTVPQIATVLDLPAGTVKSRLSRALAGLAEEHEETFHEQ